MYLQKPSGLTPVEAQTWDRVFSGAQEVRTTSSDGEARLLELIAAEQADCLAYRQLAGLCRKGKSTLLELAGDEACHARRLTARYYIQTGQWPELSAPAAPEPLTGGQETLCQALRTHYREELAGARVYAALAQGEVGDRRCLFEELAKDELRHSRAIMKLLEG